MKFDLQDKDIYQKELNYSLCYQKRSFLAKVSFVFIILLSLLMVFLPEKWMAVIENRYKSIFILGVGGMIVFHAFYTLIFARCPKCKKVQPVGYGGAEIGTGVGLSYTKGFTPFRKRCYFCGTYLSVKKLEKDRLRQQNEKRRAEIES